MNTPLDKEEFYLCTCYHDAISLSRLDLGDDIDTSEICISFWTRGKDGGYNNWREKLRHIWYIIRNGHPYLDEVILSQEDALRFSARLNSMLNTTIGTGV